MTTNLLPFTTQTAARCLCRESAATPAVSANGFWHTPDQCGRFESRLRCGVPLQPFVPGMGAHRTPSETRELLLKYLPVQA